MQKLVLFVIGFALFVGVVAPRDEEPAAASTPQRTGKGGETRIDRSEDGHFYVEAIVNDQPVKFMVDTGATPVALTIEDAARIGVEFQPDSFSVIGSGASGPVRGERVVLDSVDIDGKAASDVRGSVIEGLDISLLGQAYLSELEKVEISGDEMVLR